VLADGTIEWANDAELKLLGYTREEYVGRNIMEFHADARKIDDILCRLGRNEEIHDYEAPLLAKDGSVKWVAISSNVLFENGAFVHTAASRGTSRRASAWPSKARFCWKPRR
jgi:PAS domain S-box-containing protein